MSNREHIAAFNIAVQSPVDAWERLRDITRELIALHRSLAMLVAEEKEQRISAYLNAPENSVSGRERLADSTVLDVTTEIIKAKGEIAALSEERDFLRLYIGGLNAQDLGDASNRSS